MLVFRTPRGVESILWFYQLHENLVLSKKHHLVSSFFQSKFDNQRALYSADLINQAAPPKIHT